MRTRAKRRGIRLELWVRSHTPYGAYSRRRSALERLSHLKSEGDIESFTVNVWDEGAGMMTGEPLDAFDSRRKLGEFAAWAAAHGCTLPGFKERHLESTFTDETCTRFDPPILTLAVYDDDELLGVYPCADGENSHTVGTVLESLATGEYDRPPAA